MTSWSFLTMICRFAKAGCDQTTAPNSRLAPGVDCRLNHLLTSDLRVAGRSQLSNDEFATVVQNKYSVLMTNQPSGTVTRLLTVTD